jgi:hypothetical protein
MIWFQMSLFSENRKQSLPRRAYYASRFVKQVEGYQAFIPAALPPDPPMVINQELARLLSDADRALGRLDGVATILPNPDLFVASVRKLRTLLLWRRTC